MPRPAIKGFTHISLSVRDLDTSLAFYRDLLGLVVLSEPYEGTVFDGRQALLVAGRTGLSLQAHRANTGERFDPIHTGLDHIAFAVGSLKELEEYADHLTTAGVENSGAKPLPGFGHFIELRDPDGILIELHALQE